MRIPRALRIVAGVVAVAGLAAGAYFTRDRWIPLLVKDRGPVPSEEQTVAAAEEPKVLKLSPQARKNLGLIAKPARTQTYWKKVQIPGVVMDRPGWSDRGITSPAVGVVTQIHAFPGDTVKPGDLLFSLRLFSEYLQKTQKDLFEAARETELIDAQLARLKPLVETGSIPAARMIDLENQRKRQAASIEAHRQDLLTRGLAPDQIASVEAGNFVATVDVVAPSPLPSLPEKSAVRKMGYRLLQDDEPGIAYEVQELAAELGQQVQAGQLLSTLSNHRALYIEGHAFKRDAPALENATLNGWEIVVEFAEDDPAGWPEMTGLFRIRHLANSIDTVSRTFDFFIPFTNQSRSYETDGQTFVVWRFRPGQRTRLHVPVEKLDDVFVMPAEAVVRENAEAYAFRQNGDLFTRVPVQVLHEDRLNIVLASDGSIRPGLYFAQNAAASLNRVLKAQAASGIRADVHVHADGTVHAAH